MSYPLQIKDKDGNYIGIPCIRGKSAYEHAVEGGYKGTEEEFNQAIAELHPNTEHTENKKNPHKVTAEQVGAIPTHYPTSADLNTDLMKGDNTVTICCYYGDTLNTPHKEEKTACTHGMVITNAHNALYATQLCLPSGDDILFLRQLSGGVASEWFEIYNSNYIDNALSKAVKKTGDTMTGGLTIDKASNWGQVAMHSPAGNYRCLETDDQRVRIDVRDENDTDNRRYVDIFSNRADSRLSHAFRFTQSQGGTVKTAYMLHNENISDFVISKGSYDGAGTLSKVIPIRKTTQAVIVYGINVTAPYTFGILVRGVNSAHCDLSYAVNNGTTCDVAWSDTNVTVSYPLSSPMYAWNLNDVKYHYVVIG